MAQEEVTRLIEEMKLSFAGDEHGEARYGPALKWLLHDVDAQLALRRPFPNLHTIWELVLHVIAWKKYTAARLRDESALMTDEINWEPILRTDEAAWKDVVSNLESAQAELLDAASRLTDENLSTPPAGGKTPRYRALHGIMQHDIYHGGQIALLKKAAG